MSLAGGIAAGSQPADRWSPEPDAAITWRVDRDSRLPHEDHIEMSGPLVSVIVRYGVDEDGLLTLTRQVVGPTLRTIPNDTHASLSHTFGREADPEITVDGVRVSGERPRTIRLDGTLTIESTTDQGLRITRTLVAHRHERAVLENWVLTNDSDAAMRVEVVGRSLTTEAHGVEGLYTMGRYLDSEGQCDLGPGQQHVLAVIFSAGIGHDWAAAVAEHDEHERRSYAQRLFGSLRLETPDPVLNRAFDFAKLRAAESIFETKGGLMHGPGGGAYYAAIWANDQAEYAGPFFPFLGDEAGNEASLNCYRLFAGYMKDDYAPIPSSIIAEGTDVWAGAGDRGDAAMVAYGAARFALARGDRAIAEELWPAIEWCLEYCRRRMTPEGVVASDSDELEGRFPAGDANLNTSCLTYGGLRGAAHLGRGLGKGDAAAEYDRRADALAEAIERHFGATVEGHETYRYYDGNDVLRAWICVPLTMGLLDRAEGTIEALFSPRLWTDDGLATEAGQETFWDRATLYGLRGVFAAGDTERALSFLAAYTRRRLLGDHVPYAVEAYPEGGQRHLSAESALYCRVYTEGLFGITPTGLRSFDCVPRLPEGWDAMALRDVKAFGNAFDVEVLRDGERSRVRVSVGSRVVFEETCTGEPLRVVLPE